MTRDTALSMIHQYSNFAKDDNDTLYMIHRRFPEDGSENKAMRWLGYCQGVLVERGALTLEQVKNHSRNGRVDKEDWNAWNESRD